jgi:hypothetical protein
MSLENKIQKLNEQRFSTIVILCNVLDDDRVDSNIKSAIAASLINMMDNSMNPEDKPLVQLMNSSIDRFCEEIKEKRGIEDYRSELLKQVLIAKDTIKIIKEKQKRILEGDSILKGICLN